MSAPPAIRLADVAPPAADELLVVVGPTASGKTALAVELAQRFDAEIVGADSVQIYRHFDIGSGKPTAEERAAAPHHLVDAVDPHDALDARRYVELADAAIAELRARGKAVILCGGTFLWIKALLFGLAPSAPADPELRARHDALAQAQGREALHAALAKVDADSAARLAPNDLVRVSRALEVYELTGATQTERHAAHRFGEQRHTARLLGVARDRAELDARIEARTSRWLEQGWLDEVRHLHEAGYGACRAMGSVGYKQVAAHLQGEVTADELHRAIVRATRTFVRRQRTWLRDQPVCWLEP